MIEELKLIQTIVGDLSSVGGWVAGGFILYKILVNMTMMIGGGFLVKRLVEMAFAHFKADITRAEANTIKAENTEIKASSSAKESAARSELERVKHMYKLLKEAKDGCTEDK
jgi:hypothetical protein